MRIDGAEGSPEFPTLQGDMTDAVDHDEAHASTAQLIKLHGYLAETHHAWTEDGYRLELHRIPRPPPEKISHPTSLDSTPLPSGNPDGVSRRTDSSSLDTGEATRGSERPRNDRIPVLVQHGLLSSSADFVLLGPQKGFAYALCDSGYDVWLGNARGNAYSQHHKRFGIKDKQFWDFSWHEIGYYDLPAMIDYILETTGHDSLYYIGYSQGTTVFYVMASERPEYNAKVKEMISLAPIAFLANQRSPLLKVVVHFYNFMEWGSSYCNIHQWFPRNRLQARVLGTLIRHVPTTFTRSVCTTWLCLIAGFGSNQLDKTMLPLIFGHFPAGSSYKQIIHYGQSVQNGSFRKFDYGAKKNLQLYGSSRPPQYNLGNIKVPITMFYSENDFVSDPRDLEALTDKLPNVIEKHKIEYAKFNHIDYLWGIDAKTLVYNNVIRVLKRM